MPTSFLTKIPKAYNEEKTASSKTVAGQKWLSACRNLKLDPCPSPCTEINSKWIQDLNIRPKMLQLIHERAKNTLETIGIGKDFLTRTPAAQQLRKRMDKWNYMKF
jgi:hypothetical protein